MYIPNIYERKLDAGVKNLVSDLTFSIEGGEWDKISNRNQEQHLYPILPHPSHTKISMVSVMLERRLTFYVWNFAPPPPLPLSSSPKKEKKITGNARDVAHILQSKQQNM